MVPFADAAQVGKAMVVTAFDVVDVGRLVPAALSVPFDDFAAVSAAFEDDGAQLGLPVVWEPTFAVGSLPAATHRRPLLRRLRSLQPLWLLPAAFPTGPRTSRVRSPRGRCRTSGRGSPSGPLGDVDQSPTVGAAVGIFIGAGAANYEVAALLASVGVLTHCSASSLIRSGWKPPQWRPSLPSWTTGTCM